MGSTHRGRPLLSGMLDCLLGYRRLPGFEIGLTDLPKTNRQDWSSGRFPRRTSLMISRAVTSLGKTADPFASFKRNVCLG